MNQNDFVWEQKEYALFVWISYNKLILKKEKSLQYLPILVISPLKLLSIAYILHIL